MAADGRRVPAGRREHGWGARKCNGLPGARAEPEDRCWRIAASISSCRAVAAAWAATTHHADGPLELGVILGGLGRAVMLREALLLALPPSRVPPVLVLPLPLMR